jgi:hypothetical protein
LLYELRAEHVVAIAQQILRRTVPRKSFPKLLSGRLDAGMRPDGAGVMGILAASILAGNIQTPARDKVKKV